MTQEDNMRIAREAGFVEYELEAGRRRRGYDIRYERFAALVRADEREAMVAEAAKKGWAMRGEDPFEDCVREIADIRARGQA